MGEASLSTLANLAEIIGAGSIITGLVFGWFQIRHFREQKRDAVAINLMQTFFNGDLAHAIALLQPLPDGISLEEIKAEGVEHVTAAITVTTAFETMGLLAYKKIAPTELVLELAGGIVITMARKLRTWQIEMREVQQQPSWAEWFDWLANEAEKKKHPLPPKPSL